MVPFNRVRFFVGQPRTHFDPVELKRLAHAIIQEGQQDPVWVRALKPDEAAADPDHDFELIDGERRWRACEIGKVEDIFVLVKEVADIEDQFVLSVIANFGRVEHTHSEVARVIQRFMGMERYKDLDKTQKLKAIATLFVKSKSYVEQHFALLQLHPRVAAMMEDSVPEDDRLSFSIALQLSSLNHDLQQELAEEIVRDGIKFHRACAMIRIRAEAVGEQAGLSRRGRHLSDFSRLLQRLLRRMSQDMNTLWEEMPYKMLLELMSKKTKDERAETLAKVQEAINVLHEVKSTLVEVNERIEQEASSFVE